MEASSDIAASTGVALKDRSISGVAMKFPLNRYTQTEAIPALSVVTDPPTTELMLPGWDGW